MSTFRLEKVTKKFGPLTAVNELSFKCDDQEFIAILGPSGAGKSTTLRLIAGVEQLTSGEVYIDEQNVNKIETEDRNIAMVFETYALYPNMKVYDNLAFPLRAPRRVHLYSESEIKKKVSEIAELLNMSPYLDRMPLQLSGGQRQRVALGRALVRKPSILLLDEPISHLDAKLRNKMRAELKRMAFNLNTTIVYVTHDYREALSMADRIIIIKEGVLQQIGTPVEIFNEPVNEFVADLVGEPPINILDCWIEENNGKKYLTGKTFKIEMENYLKERLHKHGLDRERDLRLGIRPMWIEYSSKQSEKFNIPAEIYISEPLGHKKILTVIVDQTLVQLEVPADFQEKEGANLWLYFDPQKTLLFKPSEDYTCNIYTG